MLQQLSHITEIAIKYIESSKQLIIDGFEKLDKFNLTNSSIKKQKIPSEQKEELKAYREFGPRLKNLYQKILRASSLLIKIQNILVTNISSIRVVEID